MTRCRTELLTPPSNWLPGIRRSKVSHLFCSLLHRNKAVYSPQQHNQKTEEEHWTAYDCFLFPHSRTSKTRRTPSFQTWFQLLWFHFSVHVVALWVMWYPPHTTPSPSPSPSYMLLLFFKIWKWGFHWLRRGWRPSLPQIHVKCSQAASLSVFMNLH